MRSGTFPLRGSSSFLRQCHRSHRCFVSPAVRHVTQTFPVKFLRGDSIRFRNHPRFNRILLHFCATEQRTGPRREQLVPVLPQIRVSSHQGRGFTEDRSHGRAFFLPRTLFSPKCVARSGATVLRHRKPGRLRGSSHWSSPD